MVSNCESDGIVIDFKLMHLVKADSPIDVTVDGIEIDDNDSQ